MTAGCISTRIQSPLAAYEQSLVYYPSRFPEGNWQPSGLKFEDARFTAEDGTRLHGWFVPHIRPRAVVLFAHGNAGNISHRAETLRILNQRHGLAVMAFDYRGYGRSEGDPNEQGLLQDARAARKWLAERTGVSQREIVLMGRSLGGGVMVDLAAEDGARGLILASTFTSLPDVAAEHIKWIPARALMKNRFDSLSKLGRYKGPLLQSHGDADEIIPYELGRTLFETAVGPKRFVTIPGGTHNSPQNEEYRRALDEFIGQLP
ncbi:MAG: alpha/beta hydrolase [Planctomycetes bacterium]|nr:alpha/beta hydrolase [Planctomycetota bacterium]